MSTSSINKVSINKVLPNLARLAAIVAGVSGLLMLVSLISQIMSNSGSVNRDDVVEIMGGAAIVVCLFLAAGFWLSANASRQGRLIGPMWIAISGLTSCAFIIWLATQTIATAAEWMSRVEWASAITLLVVGAWYGIVGLFGVACLANWQKR